MEAAIRSTTDLVLKQRRGEHIDRKSATRQIWAVTKSIGNLDTGCNDDI